MKWHLLRVGGLAVGGALVLLACGGLARSSASGVAGDPTHGAAVWLDAGCGTCHAFARAGSSGQPGSDAPNLDRWLLPDAARAHLPVDLFVYRRVGYGGRGMPAFGTTLSPQDLEDVVSFVAGTSFAAPAGDTSPLAPLPPPPRLVTASARTVASWTTVERLTGKAERGAALFAKVGCLSCHTYLGSGSRARGAADLTRIGAAGGTAAWFQRYLAQPYVFGNTLMPTYADLAADRLASLAAFLAASRGRR